MTTKKDVEQFLIILYFAAQNKVYIKWNDEDNKKTLLSLEYMEDDIRDILLGLTADNYSEGPEEDENGYKNPVWMFGKMIEGREIYIKVKVNNLSQEGDREINIYCYSFHDSKWPMKYPFR